MAQARKIRLSLGSVLTATCENPTPSGQVTSLSRRLASVPGTLQSSSCRVASPSESSWPSLHAGSLSEERRKIPMAWKLPMACCRLALEFPEVGTSGVGPSSSCWVSPSWAGSVPFSVGEGSLPLGFTLWLWRVFYPLVINA